MTQDHIEVLVLLICYHLLTFVLCFFAIVFFFFLFLWGYGYCAFQARQLRGCRRIRRLGNHTLETQHILEVMILGVHLRELLYVVI